MSVRAQIRLLIYLILLITFFSGVPTVHYLAAIMIGLLIHYKDHSEGLLARVELGRTT